jgi:hypothetical protein
VKKSTTLTTTTTTITTTIRTPQNTASTAEGEGGEKVKWNNNNSKRDRERYKRCPERPLGENRATRLDTATAQGCDTLDYLAAKLPVGIAIHNLDRINDPSLIAVVS